LKEENKQIKSAHKRRKKWFSNKITQIEKNHRKNKTKKFFEGIQNYKQQVTLPIIRKMLKIMLYLN
jgi:hypothetical protein